MAKKLFIDMDGVLARIYENKNWHACMDKAGFFLNLNPYLSLIESLSQIVGVELYIISAVTKPTVVDEKSQWIKRHMPGIRIESQIFVPVGTNKAAVVDRLECKIDSDCYLLDDYNKNLREWTKFGGVGIKYVNEINDVGTNGPRWEGRRVHHDNSPEKILRELKAALGIVEDHAIYWWTGRDNYYKGKKSELEAFRNALLDDGVPWDDITIVPLEEELVIAK